MTKTLTINRPTNGYGTTTYGIWLIGHGRKILIHFTARSTKQAIRNAVYSNAEAILSITGTDEGATIKDDSKKINGYRLIDSCGKDTGWTVERNGTSREMHGQTIEALA
jgi:hypothetical protein